MVRQAVFRYTTKPNLSSDEIGHVENQGSAGFWANTTSNALHLLWGLIAEGVLAFIVSQKRRRVSHGLDAIREPRTKLAVPYRAKDSPTPNFKTETLRPVSSSCGKVTIKSIRCGHHQSALSILPG